MYAIVKNGQVLATGTLEGMFISNVFPPSGTPQWMLEHNVYKVVTPSYNQELEQLTPTAPVITGDTVVIHAVIPKPPQPEPIPEQVILAEPSIELSEPAADSVV